MPSINTELGERALSKMQHEMDWKPLKERCLRTYPTWSSRHVDRILKEYQRFLALKVATRDVYDTIVLAPMLLNAMWRQHILSTQQYYADCQMLLQANQILHYNADASINVRQSVREKRMELTKASLCMMFSGMYPLSSDAKGIWDYEETEGSTMDSALSSLPGEDQEETTDDFATGTEEDTETDELPPHSPRPRSPRKERDREKTRKTQSTPMKALTLEHQRESKEEQRRLIYIYRTGKVSKLNTYSHETIKNIKAKIHRKAGLTPQQQMLAWEGVALEDNKTIGQYGIPNDATLVLTITKKSEQQRRKRNQEEPSINTEMRTAEDETIEDLDESDDTILDEERDEPDERPERRSGSPSHRKGSPNRRRSAKSPAPMSPLQMSPRLPRPQRASPRKHNTPTHPPYHSPTIHEDDSYISTSIHLEAHSAVHSELNSEGPSEDPRRRQQALLNKMKIQSRDQHDNDRHHDEHHHRHEDCSFEPQSTMQTIESRPRPKPAQPINVFVNTIMGFTITLMAKSSDTVDHLKQLIEAQEDIPFRKQILILDGVPLNDSQFLSDYTSGTSLHILLRLSAGSNSVASVTASSMSPVGSNSMMTVTRKKNQNKIMARMHDVSTTNRTGTGTTNWS